MAEVFERTGEWFRPRILCDVTEVSVATTVLGTSVRSPVLVAPVAFHRVAHPEGEVATARGAADGGSIMVVSTRASTTLEDIAEAAPGAALWFQVYVLRDREWTADLVARAAAAGRSRSHKKKTPPESDTVPRTSSCPASL